MAQSANFLHTTHRTVSWFQKSFQREELELSAPYQRNPVWTTAQKAFLIDTILQGLPVPELYMQDSVNEEGGEAHVVVDGQQRIRACLDFLAGNYALDGDDIKPAWRGRKFDSLTPTQKQDIYGYKFVVRILPEMPDDALRAIFARLNRNVVALNAQELRNATYWGPFISAIHQMADSDEFWATAGIFSANDHRRMIDHEFISELAMAYLHGPQNKKDQLDECYQRYEEEFSERDQLVSTFSKVTAEIQKIIPHLAETRWRKKSDFYTLFLILAERVDDLPFASDVRKSLEQKLISFGNNVDDVLKLEEPLPTSVDFHVTKYARNVARAASDKASRIERQDALTEFAFN